MMRRERRQQPFTRKASAPIAIVQPENFSLGSLKIKEKQPQPQRNYPISLLLLVGIIVIFTAIQLCIPALSSSSSNTATAIATTVTAAVTATTLLRQANPMLPKPGEYAPVRQKAIIPLVELWRAPTPEYHIFSISSEQDVAFTVLSNILMGLFDHPEEHLGIIKWSSIGNQYLTRHKNEWADNNMTIVSHVLDMHGNTDSSILHLQREFRTSYRNLFFFVVDRGQPECQTPQDAIMMCIPQSDLIYQGIEDEKVVIGRVVQRIQRELPYFKVIDFSAKQLESLRRLDLVDDMQLQMRDLPMTSSETKYGIKGGTAV